MEIPPRGRLGPQSVTINMVVDESGVPVPESVTVSGANSALAERTFREAARKW